MRPIRKKLLVAAVGVAAINYAGCHDKPVQTGNLMAVPEPVHVDAGTPEQPAAPDAAAPMIMSGNLMAPPPPPPPTTPTAQPSVAPRIRTGNLMPPPPPPGTVKPVPTKK